MTKVLIVSGSARPNSVNKKVVGYVKEQLEAKNAEVAVADLESLNLPFYDGETPPSVEGYQPTSPAVKEFSSMVNQSDGVVFVSPEYNHSISAILKNALDSLYKEWSGKPAAFVGYGWYAAKYSHDHFLDINAVLNMFLVEEYTGLKFKKDIEVDGSLLDGTTARGAIDATIDELLGKIKS